MTRKPKFGKGPMGQLERAKWMRDRAILARNAAWKRCQRYFNATVNLEREGMRWQRRVDKCIADLAGRRRKTGPSPAENPPPPAGT